ncbi:MAG: sugar ABC transporter permease [Spirochaetaceae bacterium]|nr:sugar ABC transporter permease [Spirochaetaceae bacterium]
MFIMLTVIMIGFAILTTGINLSPRNFTNIFIQNSYILVLAVGMVLVIIIGNIDLSVGSIAAFTGAIAAILYNTGIGLFLTVFLTIGAGLIIGMWQGYWIAYVKIPAFIVTLAGMLLFRGLTYIITNVTPITPKTDSFKQLSIGTVSPQFLRITALMEKRGKMVPQDIHLLPIIVGLIVIIFLLFIALRERNKKIRNNFHVLPVQYFIGKQVFLIALILVMSVQFAQYRGIPIVFIILAITVAIFTFMTKNTIFGRYIYAVGGNSKSAKLSGINSENITFFVHVIMGGLCGLSGILFTAYMNSALPDAGDLFELEAIAASFIGGASASGGIGTIIGAIMGGLIMGIINNGMSLMNIGANWQYVVKALVLLLAVWYDIYTRKKSGMV